MNDATDDLAAVTPEQWADLQADLDEMARTDPEIAAASKRLDETIEDIELRRRVPRATFPRKGAT